MTEDERFKRRLALADELAALLMGALPTSARTVTQRYVVGLTVQFRSYLKAVALLLSNGHDSEAWIVGRSMAEALIRLKWVHQRQSYVDWIVLDTECRDKGRLGKIRSRHRRPVTAVIDKRLSEFAANKPKTGAYWDKRKHTWKPLPHIECIAKQCRMLMTYRTYFKVGGDHTHLSHRVLSRYIKEETDGGWNILVDYASPESLAFSSHFLIVLGVQFLESLEKHGYSVDKRYHAIADEMEAMCPTSSRMH